MDDYGVVIRRYWQTGELFYTLRGWNATHPEFGVQWGGDGIALLCDEAVPTPFPAFKPGDVIEMDGLRLYVIDRQYLLNGWRVQLASTLQQTSLEASDA